MARAWEKNPLLLLYMRVTAPYPLFSIQVCLCLGKECADLVCHCVDTNACICATCGGLQDAAGSQRQLKLSEQGASSSGI